jgi:hypothetical protein
MGRRTCASASALNLDAQPAQLDRLVSRIWRPEGECEGVLMRIIINGKGTHHGWLFRNFCDRSSLQELPETTKIPEEQVHSKAVDYLDLCERAVKI